MSDSWLWRASSVSRPSRVLCFKNNNGAEKRRNRGNPEKFYLPNMPL
jgi:hypothetical protein